MSMSNVVKNNAVSPFFENTEGGENWQPETCVSVRHIGEPVFSFHVLGKERQ
jgi:hypothetical protein